MKRDDNINKKIKYERVHRALSMEDKMQPEKRRKTKKMNIENCNLISCEMWAHKTQHILQYHISESDYAQRKKRPVF